jgi:CBS domain-containing protein
MESPLSAVLQSKEEKQVLTVLPTDTIMQAAHKMIEHKVGATLVMEGEALKGMFTERDVLRMVDMGQDPNETLVLTCMTKNVQAVPSNMRVAGAMKLMTERHFRHLPVVEEGKVIGIISIGDLTRWVSQSQEIKIRDLEKYIYGQ